VIAWIATRMASPRASLVRAPSPRRIAFILENACSIGVTLPCGCPARARAEGTLRAMTLHYDLCQLALRRYAALACLHAMQSGTGR
jgi:hypothetical protein